MFVVFGGLPDWRPALLVRLLLPEAGWGAPVDLAGYAGRFIDHYPYRRP